MPFVLKMPLRMADPLTYIYCAYRELLVFGLEARRARLGAGYEAGHCGRRWLLHSRSVQTEWMHLTVQ